MNPEPGTQLGVVLQRVAPRHASAAWLSRPFTSCAKTSSN